MIELAPGLIYRPAHFSRAAQEDLVAAVREVVRQAPLFTPTMPRTGKEFSVRMTNCGPLGWMSDRDGGYRYQETHPATGQRWPAIPGALLALWRDVAGRSTFPGWLAPGGCPGVFGPYPSAGLDE